ncbi:hypothetical protein ASE86_03940 [Sphingomonas sp. Leaf33]|uniref:type II toxin-antitoxin system VapC family toxin n=1 Tax=Sphingomonas sp. Leaf33 TaxID=1736215 RepID=UPI0006FB7A24|nr:type II toxin-antitoxin system VapC family toxin [Sphingomonas sp. Leaf33]KQN25400.1 hypothetical protein ASE86_03940 [Sphingomonas sp. Leaf33]
MRFLLDTNTIVALTRHQHPVVRDRIALHYGTIGLSTIVAHELAYGAFVSDRPEHHLRTIDDLPFERLDFTENDARAAGDVRATLRKVGTAIGPYDTLIAGQALARSLTLVTNNTREFARVAGLRVEDWTAA